MPRSLSDIPLLVLLMASTGIAMLVPAFHAVMLEDERTARAFAQSAFLVLLFSMMLAVATHRPGLLETPRGYLVSIGLAFMILPALMALPLMEASRTAPFMNAWFEMVSCFTTTGATLFDAPGQLTDSLHLWRALVGWFGGFFVLIVAGAVMAPLNLGGAEVVSGQTPGRNAEGASQITATATPSRRLMRQVTDLLPVYLALTLVLWLGLVVVGVDGFAALCQALSTLSTSGISPGPPAEAGGIGLGAKALIFLFLCLAITRRSLRGFSVTGHNMPLWKDPEVRLAACLIAIVAMLFLLRQAIEVGDNTTLPNRHSLGRGLLDAIFTAMSFLTTTGFLPAATGPSIGGLSLGLPGLVLVGLAIVGGGVATTAGGVKLLRIHALMRHGEHELEHIVHPHSVGSLGPSERRLRRGGAMVAWVFFMLFATAIAAVTGALTLTGLQFEPALVFCLSALTLTGPLAEVGGSMPFDWKILNGGAKIILAATMILGRLEVLAVLALISPNSWRN